MSQRRKKIIVLTKGRYFLGSNRAWSTMYKVLYLYLILYAKCWCKYVYLYLCWSPIDIVLCFVSVSISIKQIEKFVWKGLLTISKWRELNDRCTSLIIIRRQKRIAAKCVIFFCGRHRSGRRPRTKNRVLSIYKHVRIYRYLPPLCQLVYGIILP